MTSRGIPTASQTVQNTGAITVNINAADKRVDTRYNVA